MFFENNANDFHNNANDLNNNGNPNKKRRALLVEESEDEDDVPVVQVGAGVPASRELTSSSDEEDDPSEANHSHNKQADEAQEEDSLMGGLLAHEENAAADVGAAAAANNGVARPHPPIDVNMFNEQALLAANNGNANVALARPPPFDVNIFNEQALLAANAARPPPIDVNMFNEQAILAGLNEQALQDARNPGLFPAEEDDEEDDLENGFNMAHVQQFAAGEDFDYGMRMMQAMEDGSEEEEEPEDDDDDDQAEPQQQGEGVDAADNIEERLEAFATRHLEDTSRMAGLRDSILGVCSSLTQAVREYYLLSQSEQSQVWDDMRGGQQRGGGGRNTSHKNNRGKELAQEPYEAQPMVELALVRLPLELERMPNSHPHAALDRVLEESPDYVLDRAFLLKFLRAEKFDVFATASRLCRYFEAKSELFGPDKLGRDIRLADLDEDDMAAFRNGYIQILQTKDHDAHQNIIFYYKAVSSECYKKRENILRAFFYMTDRLSQQEDVQKLGVTNIVYNNGGFPRQGMDYEKSRRISHLFQSIPVRFNNFYVCLDDKPWLTVVETFAVMITRFLRVRLRMIKGTHDEVVEKLHVIGVPVAALPVNDQSELLVEAHLKWIQSLQRAEEQENEERLAAVAAIAAGNTATAATYECHMNTLAHLAATTTAFYHTNKSEGGGGPSNNMNLPLGPSLVLPGAES